MICTKKKHLDVCNIECEEYFECRERKENLNLLLKRGVVVPESKLQRDFRKDKAAIKKDPLRLEKEEALRACYELYYDDICREDILNAKRLYDIDLALVNGRIRKFGAD